MLILGNKRNLEGIDNIVDLDGKVECYLNWYKKNVDKNVEGIKNIIDKVSSWYEMRYSNDSIDPKYNREENCYQNDWAEVMDFTNFFSLLTLGEQILLLKPRFPSIVDITSNGFQHFHVDGDGTITDASEVFIDSRATTGENMFEGHNLREVESIVLNNNLKNFKLDGIKSVIASFNKKDIIYNGLFDAINARIISRGGDYYGPKRGMLFAKEFNRPIELSIQYGVEHQDLVEDYLTNGGREDVICHLGYFSKEGIKSIPLSELYSIDKDKNNGDKPKVYSKTK